MFLSFYPQQLYCQQPCSWNLKSVDVNPNLNSRWKIKSKEVKVWWLKLSKVIQRFKELMLSPTPGGL